MAICREESLFIVFRRFPKFRADSATGFIIGSGAFIFWISFFFGSDGVTMGTGFFDSDPVAACTTFFDSDTATGSAGFSLTVEETAGTGFIQPMFLLKKDSTKCLQ